MPVALLNRTALALFMIAGFALPPALADEDHGVRVHRLIPKGSVVKKVATIEDDDEDDFDDVEPHSHRVILRKGRRVVVRFSDGLGKSAYRRRHPGVLRPWRARRSGGRNVLYSNPRGLYSSHLYRRGDF